MEGPDHAASLEPEEFGNLVTAVREVEEALGRGDHRYLSQGELINKENLAKSIVAAADLNEGTVIKLSDLDVKSPGQGLSPQKIDDLVGLTLQRDMKKDDYFFDSDLQLNRIEPRDYSFRRPWGVPVRYHDFKEYSSTLKPKVWEFHLSYTDMELDPAQYLTICDSIELVVHAPELFANSMLMDLAAADVELRDKSVVETQRVIDLTKSLKKFFPKTQRPLIVANIGGFSMDAPLPREERTQLYENFANSLERLNLNGVELIPQTMAPFPWHFGGQRYQNLFLESDDIHEWCDRLGLRMCLDVSHSMLACNNLNIDFYQFIEVVAPTLHIFTLVMQLD